MNILKAFKKVAKSRKYNIVTSSPVQPVKLVYNHNIASHTIGAVFVNTSVIPQLTQLSVKEKEKILIEQLKKEQNISKVKIKKQLSSMSEEQRQALNKRFFDGLEWINAKERGEAAR